MIAAALAVPLVVIASLGGQVDASEVKPPTPERSYMAQVVMQSTARVQASSSSKRVGTVRAIAPWNSGPVELYVVDSATDADGHDWVRVLLARKPNGTYGWIPANNTKLYANPWRIAVDISSRRMTIFKAGKSVRSTRAVVGARATPTPTGQFAIREIVKQPEPHGFSGPWIFHLNANSEKLKSFDGGDGIIGIHGRDGASFADPLGSARSHGCVRVPNRIVKYMASHVTGGTPVLIQR